MDLYCKIFLDARISLGELFQVLVRAFAGRNLFAVPAAEPSRYYLDTDRLQIMLEANPERNQKTLASADFLFLPYVLEVNPIGEDDTEALRPEDAELYRQAVRALIDFLREKTWRTVPACDFEEYLSREL